jgi:hypothetical protein
MSAPARWSPLGAEHTGPCVGLPRRAQVTTLDDDAAARATQRTSRTRRMVTFTFVAVALLDTLDPSTYVTGSWWLVLLLAWLMPWPGQRSGDDRLRLRGGGPLLPIAALAVLSWLHFRGCTALLDTAVYFEALQVEGRLKAVNYVAQILAAGSLAAVLLAVPLWRAFGVHSVAVAIVVAAPWFALTSANTVFDPVRWLERPRSNALSLFAAVMPPLLLMEACSLLVRHGRTVTRTAIIWRGLRAHAVARLERRTPWLAHSSVPALLVLTAAGFGLRLYLDALPTFSPAVDAAVTAITPLCAVLLTMVTVHALRRHRRRLLTPRRTGYGGGHHLATALAAGCLSVLWPWVLFIDAPLAEHYARDAIAAVPGPAWSLAYDSETRTLSLTGEYQYGVAAAFASALDRHPEARRVELAGPGGRQDEGLAIARAIEDRGLDTHVRSECVSACTLAFVAGRARTVFRDALLGFHAVTSPVHTFDPSRNYDRYLAGRGVDAGFIRQATSTPAKNLWYPSRTYLLEARVVTAID